MIESILFMTVMSLASYLTVLVARRKFIARQLRRPMLNGVYLPTISDIRWRLDRKSGWLFLGKFEVDPRDGEVVLDGDRIGFWKDYSAAIVRTALVEQQNALALLEIEQAE